MRLCIVDIAVLSPGIRKFTFQPLEGLLPAAGAGHLGPEVEERSPPEDRVQPAVARGVDHHEVEGAAAQVEDGYADGGHRCDAIP